MEKEFSSISWARYSDDGITHCITLKQAQYLCRRLDQRFRSFGIELNIEKTRIVYCKDNDRKDDYENITFNFLGYTIRPPIIQGWINYYTLFYKSEAHRTFDYINNCLIKWVRRKYKNRRAIMKARKWLKGIVVRDKNLFTHWKIGILP